jgi:hypothetical protein
VEFRCPESQKPSPPNQPPGARTGALGFYTYKLWWKITHSQPSMLSILSLVGALVCFGSAVVKQSLQGILVLTLVSELNSMVAAAASIAHFSGGTRCVLGNPT